MEKTFTKTFVKESFKSLPADTQKVAGFKPKTPGKVTPQLMQKVIANEGRSEDPIAFDEVGELNKTAAIAKLRASQASVDKRFPDMTGFLTSSMAAYPQPVYRPAVWMNAAEAAKHLKSSVVKLGKLRTLGEGPKCYKQPDGAILYEQYDLDRWVRSMPTIGSEY